MFVVSGNISAMAEDRIFKFGKQLEFAKTHYKITPNSGRGPRLGELPKIGDPLYYIRKVEPSPLSISRLQLKLFPFFYCFR